MALTDLVLLNLVSFGLPRYKIRPFFSLVRK